MLLFQRNVGQLTRLMQGRINHLVGPMHSTTPGPTGKLDAKEGERGGRDIPLPSQLGVWETLQAYKLLIGVRGGTPVENGFGEI